MKAIQVKILFALFLTSLFFCSCLEQQEKPAVVVQANPTPQILTGQKEKPIISTRSYSKGSYRGNILASLFAEAREKDKVLDSLIIKMDNIDNKWGDTTTATNLFINNNEEYYRNASALIGSLSDSALSKKSRALFNNLEEKFKTKVKTHQEMLSTINALKDKIRDQKIMTQLYVTASMIENYQNNELPDTKPLQHIIDHYNALIEQSQAYQK